MRVMVFVLVRKIKQYSSLFWIELCCKIISLRRLRRQALLCRFPKLFWLKAQFAKLNLLNLLS